MSDSNPIWKQALAGIISGVVLLLVGWMIGVLPAIWAWITGAAAYLWATVTAPLVVPTWLVLLAAIFLLVVGARTLSSGRTNRSPDNSASAPEPAADVPFDELELTVLRALTRADGAWLTIDDLADRLRTSRLLIEQAIEKLFVRELLLNRHNYVYGTSFRLSQKGRDLVIKLGYVTPSPYAA